MYEIKKGKPYYYPLLTLLYSYNIPRNVDEKYLKNYWIKYTVIMSFRFLDACVMPMLHLIMSLKGNTGVDIAEDLSVCFGVFGCILTVVLFTLQYKKWSEFFVEVTTIKKLQLTIKHLDEFANKSNRFSIMNLCYVLSGIGSYLTVTLMEAPQCMRLNEEKGLHESCYTYHPEWLPFATNDIFSAITILTLQTVVAIHTLPSAAMIFFLVLESTEILILHINILKENLISLFEETPNQEISNQEIYSKVRFCINYHNHVLRLGKRFNTLQKYTIGHMSFIAALIFGCILNQIQTTKPFCAALYLLGYITITASACHAGQRIMDQTTSIAQAVYSSNWIKADPQTMKDLAMIILRCQTPVCLDCIPLGNFNYALFVAIIKTSYSYLTLLNGST